MEVMDVPQQRHRRRRSASKEMAFNNRCGWDVFHDSKLHYCVLNGEVFGVRVHNTLLFTIFHSSVSGKSTIRAGGTRGPQVVWM